VGARFSNAILQTLLVLFGKKPPKGRRLLVIGTTSQHSILRQMDVMDVFDAQIPVSTVSKLKELDEILKATKTFDDSLRTNVLQQIESITGTQEMNIGIKQILSFLETSRQEEDTPGTFVDLLSYAIAQS
jgi:vesicle-fusing ATPase